MIVESEYDEGLGLFAGRAEGIMGTRLELLCAGVERSVGERVWQEMTDDAAALSRMLNRFDPSSEVSRWNAGLSEGNMSAPLQDILSVAEAYRTRTGGLFDICTGTRGLSARHPALLSSVLPSSSGPSSILSSSPGPAALLRRRRLDFGGIAKGYALARMGKMLRAEGIGNAFVDFGGSSMLALGHHPHGDCWKISLPDPWTGQVLDIFSLRDCALSVSGNRPGYTGHIINPLTGERCGGRALVSVISPDPLDAEVLSTAAFVAATSPTPESTFAAATSPASESTLAAATSPAARCPAATDARTPSLPFLRAAFPAAKITLHRPGSPATL